MAILIERIPELDTNPFRLGRHVEHDARSLLYAVEDLGIELGAISWERKVAPFDQGNLGSCTGNALLGVAMTEPFFSALDTSHQALGNEAEAVKIYERATALDNVSGTYPPDDTGSTGVAAAKACVEAGFYSGYKHALSMGALQTALASGPVALGTNWYQNMFNPDNSGLVTIASNDQVAGGHEYECWGYDPAVDEYLFWNSWGSSWGDSGAFRMKSATVQRLLSEQGDVTSPTPGNTPAPTPTPAPPGPTPTPTPPGPHITDVEIAKEGRAFFGRFNLWASQHGAP